MVFTRAVQIINVFNLVAELERVNLFLLDLEWKIFPSSTNQKMFCIQENIFFFRLFLVKAKGICKGEAIFTKGFQWHLQNWAENGR